MGHEVQAIFTFNPSKHEKWEISVDMLAKQYKIPLFLDDDFNSNRINQLKPDLIIVVGFRKIISGEILKIPKFGVIGLHASLLPHYRGMAPLNWAIINGEKKTGITLFRMNEVIDSGEIIAQKETRINFNETILEVKERIIGLAVQLLEENLPLIESGSESKIIHKEIGTYGCRRIPEDSLIDWNQSSLSIYNLIRGLEPSYAAYTFYNKKKIKILKAIMEDTGMKYFGVPGQVGMINKDKSVVVITGDDHLIIIEVQVEDKEPIRAGNVLNSTSIRLSCMP